MIPSPEGTAFSGRDFAIETSPSPAIDEEISPQDIAQEDGIRTVRGVGYSLDIEPRSPSFASPSAVAEIVLSGLLRGGG